MGAAWLQEMHDRWTALCVAMVGESHAGDAELTFGMVVSLYGTPVRWYHNLEHIAACLAVFDGVRMLAEDREAVEFALWMHDAVFNAARPDNEARSADAAGMIAALLGCAPDFVEKVRGFITATRHDVLPEEGDAALVADIDLAILGAEWGEYEAYARAIRAEFSFAGDELFNAGRAAFLERMLAKRAIYATPWFRKEYERRARENMERELEGLLGG